jgi:hypothetical protein
MKEIIASPPEVNFVLIQDAEIHSRNSYGVLLKGDDRRCFIAKDQLLSGFYRVKLAKDITSGNSFGYQNPDLRSMIVEILSKGNQVFQFDTAKELYLWLAEGL